MLKIVAMLTMLIGHMGYAFFPEHEWMRMVGRIAFPVYVWGIYQAYKKMGSTKTYAIWLFVLAVLSQIPFAFVITPHKLNVIFNLWLCLLSLWVFDKQRKEVSVPLILLMMILSESMDYGFYAIGLIFLYRFLEGKQLLIAHMLLNGLYVLWAKSEIQFLSIMGSLLVVYRHQFPYIKVNKWFYRFFYPMHLTVFYIIKSVMG